jgi:hypothetical protein
MENKLKILFTFQRREKMLSHAFHKHLMCVLLISKITTEIRVEREEDENNINNRN